MPTARRTLIKLRRYQQLLTFGGGIVLTVVVLLAFALDSLSTVRNAVINERQAWLADRSLVIGEINESEASFRNAVISTEFLWNEQHLAPDDLVQRFIANGGEVVVQPFDTLRPQIEMTLPGAHPSVEEIRRTLGLSMQLARLSTASSLLRGRALAGYHYSADGQFLAVVPLQPATDLQLRERLADRGALKRALALDPRDLPGPPGPAATGVFGERRPVRWLAPSIDPLSGIRTVRIAAMAWHNGAPLEVLVTQYATDSLLAPLAAGDHVGTFMIVSPSREVVASIAQDDPDLLDRVRQSNALDFAATAPRERFRDGMLMFTSPLASTGWTLVYALPWRSIAEAVAVPLGTSTATTAVILIALWIFVVMLNRRVFAPAFERSARVFESEHLSRTLIETAPVGLGLIATGPRTPLLRSPVMVDMASRVIVDEPSLSAELVRRYVAAREQQPDRAADHGVVHAEVTLPVREGGHVDLAASLAPARYQGADVLVAAFSDVTEKKQLEQRLLEAKQAADSANAAKSAFLAGMSHEIRTPLNAILGNLELLAHSKLDALQRDRLSTIRTSSDGLLAIISDILDFSKIEAGEMTPESIAFDVVEVMERALTIFAPVANAKHLFLHAAFDTASTQTMRGDPARVAQIVHNLLSNAIKFTARGGITLRLSIDNALADASTLVLAIEDTGIGMSAEQQQSIFNAFTQADTTINRRFGGTGLGLALCRRLLDAMHGTIDVTSEPGVGSCFTVRFPLGAEPMRDAPGFDRQHAILLATAQTPRTSLARHLEAWGLAVDACAHPALVDDAMLDRARVLIVFGARDGWRADEENRLIESARCVIDCRDDGPSIPVRTGRLFSLSCFSLRGLESALHQALNGTAPAATTNGVAVGQTAVTAANGQPLRVLVAEDNAVNGRLFAEQLRMLGCDARVVESGEAALDTLKQTDVRSWDILLTDLNMPGMSGYALAEAVRASGLKLPIVAVTAYATDDDRVRCRHTGIAHVAIKPLSLAGLLDLLVQHANARADTLPGEFPGPAQASASVLGGKEIPAELRATFVESCSQSLADLRAARAGGDAVRVAAIMHALTGALGVFGLTQLAARCRQVELRLRAADNAGLDDPDLDAVERALMEIVASADT